MTRPLASYLAPYIADGDPLPDTVTVNAADLLAAVGELRRMREALESEIGIAEKKAEYYSNPIDKHERWFFEAQAERLAAALAPADG
jgi:hypothetical protein